MRGNVGDSGRRADAQSLGSLGYRGQPRNGGQPHQPLRCDHAVLHLRQQVGAAAHSHRAGLGQERDGFIEGLGFDVLEGGIRRGLLAAGQA